MSVNTPVFELGLFNLVQQTEDKVDASLHKLLVTVLNITIKILLTPNSVPITTFYNGHKLGMCL